MPSFVGFSNNIAELESHPVMQRIFFTVKGSFPSVNSYALQNPHLRRKSVKLFPKPTALKLIPKMSCWRTQEQMLFTLSSKLPLKMLEHKRKRFGYVSGWLLDTIETMELLVEEDEKIVSFYRLQDFNKLKILFADWGHLIAGVITEFPTNPMMQSFDLENLQALCRKNQALLVVDPTMASPKNAKVSKFADIVVNSLTKYANWEGDVMMGSLVFPKQSRLGRSLMQRTQDLISKPFSRDLDRLAEQIPFYESFIEHTNASTIKVAEFLMGHPEVKEVRWAYQSRCSENYQRLAGDAKPGCVISFEIKVILRLFTTHWACLKVQALEPNSHFAVLMFI